MGGLISGMLVPPFQFTQESLRWTRQNRYDELRQHRERIRESLHQFVPAQAQTSKLNEIGLEALESADPVADGVRRQRGRRELQSLTRRRIEQNSRFVVSIFHLPEAAQQTIRTDWNDVLAQGCRLQGTVQRLIESAPEGEPLDRNAAGPKLGERLKGLNRSYEQVLSSPRRRLLAVDREGARFR